MPLLLRLGDLRGIRTVRTYVLYVPRTLVDNTGRVPQFPCGSGGVRYLVLRRKHRYLLRVRTPSTPTLLDQADRYSMHHLW